MRHPPPDGAAAIERSPVDARRISYAALMVAAALTGVYAETIPNFEVLTLVVFCSGVLLGARGGVLVGTLTMLIFTLLNPYGPAHPLVMAAQVAGEALTGAAGAAFATAGLPERPVPVRIASLAVAALLLTATFDLLTNLATGVMLGPVRLTLLQGIPFALWHIGWNIVLFVALGTPLVGVFAHYRTRLSPSR
jgi:hypothetical protein